MRVSDSKAQSPFLTTELRPARIRPRRGFLAPDFPNSLPDATLEKLAVAVNLSELLQRLAVLSPP
jgi:hypothetical protein